MKLLTELNCRVTCYSDGFHGDDGKSLDSTTQDISWQVACSEESLYREIGSSFGKTLHRYVWRIMVTVCTIWFHKKSFLNFWPTVYICVSNDCGNKQLSFPSAALFTLIVMQYAFMRQVISLVSAKTASRLQNRKDFLYVTYEASVCALVWVPVCVTLTESPDCLTYF